MFEPRLRAFLCILPILIRLLRLIEDEFRWYRSDHRSEFDVDLVLSVEEQLSGVVFRIAHGRQSGVDIQVPLP